MHHAGSVVYFTACDVLTPCHTSDFCTENEDNQVVFILVVLFKYIFNNNSLCSFTYAGPFFHPQEDC